MNACNCNSVIQFIIIASVKSSPCYHVFRWRERLHQEWLERERIAQEEFRLRKEKEEAARRKNEDEQVTQEFIKKKCCFIC